MRKRALLIVGLALMIAAAGVAYAHWTETLVVDASVSTGNMFVRWTNIFTDDDGGNSEGEEPGVIGNGTPVEPDGVYDYNVGFSSTDPSSVGYPTFASRYEKDVAYCSGGITDGLTTGKLMYVTAGNTYPSYNCTIWSYFQNQGTVPVKVQSVTTTITGGDLGVDAEWLTLKGTPCGLQIDPGETYYTVNWFHILQGAGEGETYTLHQDLNFVNWNEWSADACGGLPLATP